VEDGLRATGHFELSKTPGLLDRSSRPHLSASRLAPSVEAEIETLRRRRLSGPKIAPPRGVLAERLFNQPPRSRIATTTIVVIEVQ
jgi:hypothetical protein